LKKHHNDNIINSIKLTGIINIIEEEGWYLVRQKGNHKQYKHIIKKEMDARGSQYKSYEYRTLLRKHGYVQSMSSSGNCYDNAVMESFFHSLNGIIYFL
jgi:transposase InsO family protein